MHLQKITEESEEEKLALQKEAKELEERLKELEEYEEIDEIYKLLQDIYQEQLEKGYLEVYEPEPKPEPDIDFDYRRETWYAMTDGMYDDDDYDDFDGDYSFLGR